MKKFGKTFTAILYALSIAFLGMQSGHAQDATQSKATPPGTPASAKTQTLKAGAKALQSNAPVKGFDIYLVGFHPMKEHPEMQMEAHHYCHQVNEDFAQYISFDSNTKDANMNGVEYIISEKLFDALPICSSFPILSQGSTI